MSRKKVGAEPASELQLDLMLALFEAPKVPSDFLATVAELRGAEPPLATFYRQLQQTVDWGWVRHEPAPDPSEARPATRGRPRRICRLTEAGERILKDGLEKYGRRLRHAHALGLLSGS